MSQRAKSLMVLLPLFCVAVLIAIPNFIRGRTVRAYNACINNIRQVDGAKQQWEVENHKSTNDVVTWNDVLPYLKGMPVCPDGGTYTLGRIGEEPRCSHKR